MDPKILLSIVKTWRLNKKPEYRGFRCGNCQKYLKTAWHYLLEQGGCKTPVHFCQSCRIKLKLSKKGAVYKAFTCDTCGGKMSEAYHVWSKKRETLSEAHFCKTCGERMKLNKSEIKGVIYDLDGTLISTLKAHRLAWLAAAKKFNIRITKKMLSDQSGMSDETAALMMLPKGKKRLLWQFVRVKQNEVKGSINKISLFPGATESIAKLLQRGYEVWICTSAYKFFAKEVLNLSLALGAKIKNNVVWREMYKKAKPAPDALLLTIKKMGLKKPQVCYVGDAINDYKTSVSAKVKFIYFCPNARQRDPGIPKDIVSIPSHKDIFDALGLI